MRTHTCLVAAAIIAAVASCQRPSSNRAAPVSDPRDEFLKQVAAIERAVSEKASFVEATAGAFAPSGLFAGAGAASQRGPAGARAWLARDSMNLTSRGRWHTVFGDVSDDGRDGYTFGYLDVFRASGDSALGTFHAYWRRSNEGRWQILAMGRARRDATRSPTPHSLVARVRAQRPLLDTVATYAELARTEVAFSDASAADLPKAFVAFAEPTAAKSDGSVYIFGREPIGVFFNGQKPPPGFTGIQWKPDHGSVARSGDLGFTTGPVTRRGDSQPSAGQTGRYFTIWRRQPDGTWKYVID
jgi:ketosteroid isomerase-like protein